MFKKTLIASALALASLASFAADYYVVTPAPGKDSTANIVVTLNAASLPAAKVSQAYSYDLNQALQVTGDPAFAGTGVIWTLANGSTPPPGLSLGSNGVISGTATTKNTNGQSFEVVATYKTKAGQQAYTIVVNGASFDVTKISSMGSTTCAVTTTGGAKCWGDNTYGQLGNNSTSNSQFPVDVVGLTAGVVSISGGSSHTCALTTSGGAKCWGDNSFGQLGNNSSTPSLVPVDVVGLTSGVASIGGGGSHNCVITTSGGAKCWGYNIDGQLGNNSTSMSRVPVAVSGLTSGVASISGGLSHTCALTTNGGAKCWGANILGQLGNNSTLKSKVPVDVFGLTSGVASISGGGSHTCVITTSGGAKCWGYNEYGQLGNNSGSLKSLVPVDVLGLTSGVASISGGDLHTCAVTTSGGAKCWGSNDYGEQGNNSTTYSRVPVDVLGLTSGVAAISGGTSHTCAITTSGGAKCWGGSTTQSLVPVDVLPQ